MSSNAHNPNQITELVIQVRAADANHGNMHDSIPLQLDTGGLTELTTGKLPNWGPNEPQSSGSEDNRGRKKKTHIKVGEKKTLTELVANICHTELNRRGKGEFWRIKDEFWRILVRRRKEGGGPDHNWHTVKSCIRKEMNDRKKELEEDDTSGHQIRQSDYYSHLDILIERTNLIAAPSEKQVENTQQLTRQNLSKHLNQKRSLGDMTVDEEFAGQDGNSESGSIRSQQSQKQRRGNQSIA